jgi:hypothetical protein
LDKLLNFKRHIKPVGCLSWKCWLKERLSGYDTTEITLQQLSDFFWTSFGVNRPDGKRTAPSSNDKQEIDIYVLLKKGVNLYNVQNHKLMLVAVEDIRRRIAG